MKCVWLLLFMLSVINGSAHADVFAHPQSAQQLMQGALAKPAATLGSAQLMRGKFVYRKFLKEIPQPLVSRGEFVFARALGIHWHTLEPFDSEFVLSEQGMTQRDAGKTTLQMSAAEQPAVKVVASIFLALLSLDVSSLQNSFALFGQQQGTEWQVGLQPRIAAVATVFKDAVVSGAAQVQALVLHDANGDRTEISFTDIHYANELAASDRALFTAR